MYLHAGNLSDLGSDNWERGDRENRSGNCIVEIANCDINKLKRGNFRGETQKILINFMIIRKKFVPLQQIKIHLFKFQKIKS